MDVTTITLALVVLLLILALVTWRRPAQDLPPEIRWSFILGAAGLASALVVLIGCTP